MNVGIGGQQPNIFHKFSDWLKLVELSMAMALESVEDETMFFYLVLHEEQIEQPTHNTFEFGCAHVGTKFL